MGQVLQLEDFAQYGSNSAVIAQNIDLSELKKETFDTGYRDGWNDAFDEARTEEGKARSSIAASLEEMGFTYFEARQHIMGSFKPLLDAMLGSVLPHASREALIPLIQQEMAQLAKQVEPPIKLLCAPSSVDALREMVTTQASLPIEVEAEDTLLPSQIQLRYAEGFSSIDTQETIARIESAVEDFFAPNPSEGSQYG